MDILVGIYFDVVVLYDCNLQGMGITARSNNREVLFGSAKQFSSRMSIEVSETIALLEMVSDAIARGWNFVEFERDYLNVVNLFKQGICFLVYYEVR